MWRCVWVALSYSRRCSPGGAFELPGTARIQTVSQVRFPQTSAIEPGYTGWARITTPVDASHSTLRSPKSFGNTARSPNRMSKGLS